MKAKQQQDIENPQIQLVRQKKKLHHVPCDAIIQKKRKQELPVQQEKPCGTPKRIPIAKTQTQKVAVSNAGEEGDPLFERAATRKDKAKNNVRVQKVYSSQRNQ